MGNRLPTLQALRALGRPHQQNIALLRNMTSKTSHAERTAADRREPSMHTVVLDCAEHFNRTIRLIKLRPVGEKPKA